MFAFAICLFSLILLGSVIVNVFFLTASEKMEKIEEKVKRKRRVAPKFNRETPKKS